MHLYLGFILRAVELFNDIKIPSISNSEPFIKHCGSTESRWERFTQTH